MSATLRIRSKNPRRRLQPITRLAVEALETRFLPASFSWTGAFPAVTEVEPNDTIVRAQELGNLTQAGQAGVVGTIANSNNGGGVDWYQFTLTTPANVHLATLDQAGGSKLVSALSLYNHDAFDFADPFDPLAHRLLAQDDGGTHGGDAAIDRLLGAGTYFVAISGSSNLYFHPQLPNSGYPGSIGDYGLSITTSDTGIAATDGPAVLTVDPAPGSVLSRSPYVIRVDFSSTLDPSTFVFAGPGQDPSTYANPAPGQTIELRFSPTGDFSPGNYSDIAINPPNGGAAPNFSNAVNELQIIPAAPLGVGFYQLFLAGNNSTGQTPVLTDLNTGMALGTNSQNPTGADDTTTFQVNGIDGVVGASTPADTVTTAHDLKDITQSGLVQAAGVIGVDPTDPLGYNGAAVETYHFTITGPGKYAFAAEVFAQRIGSPLDAAVTLLQRLPDGTLGLVDVNNNTNNNVAAPPDDPNGGGLISSDAALFDGLTQGEYFIVVSSAPNFPDSTAPWQAGTQANGSFDPTTSQSANPTTLANWGLNSRTVTIGPYVLNLAATSDNVAPTVVSVTPADGTTLTAPLTQLTVQFSKPMNLLALANQAFQQTNQGTVSSVYLLRPSDGKKFFPRVQPYYQDTNSVPFLMLDDLADGVYELHLSGAKGLTDFAGNPLVGNDPSGDYVTTFTVQRLAGAAGDPLQRVDQEPNDDAAHPQDLGVFFPLELAQVTHLGNGTDQNGITIVRDFTQNQASAPSDSADYYQFQVLQNQTYVFTLNGLNLPSGVNLQFSLWDSNQNVLGKGIKVPGAPGQLALSAGLTPGTYVIGITGWQTDAAAVVAYHLNVSLAGAADNPPPLTYGAAPAARLNFVPNPPPPPPVSNPNPPAPAISSNPPPTLSQTSTPPANSASSSGSSSDSSTPPANPTPTPSANPTPTPPANPTPTPSASSTPPAPPPASVTPTPTPPANATPPVPPPASATPTPTPAAPTPPPVTPPAPSLPPAPPPVLDLPPTAPPLVSLPPSSPSAPSRPNLPIPGTGDATPVSTTPVVSAPPSSNTAPTGNGPTVNAPAPAAPVAAAGNASSSPTIPSGVLLALGAGPVGGAQTYTVTGVPSFPDRVIVQGTNPVNVDVVRIVTLTQSSQISGNDSKVSLEGAPVSKSPNGLPGLSQGTNKPLLRLLQHALDSFFGMGDWLFPLGPTQGQEPTPADGGTNEDNLESSRNGAAADAAWVDDTLTLASEGSWGGVLAAMGTVALIGGQGPRRRSFPPLVRLRHGKEK